MADAPKRTCTNCAHALVCEINRATDTFVRDLWVCKGDATDERRELSAFGVDVRIRRTIARGCILYTYDPDA